MFYPPRKQGNLNPLMLAQQPNWLYLFLILQIIFIIFILK